MQLYGPTAHELRTSVHGPGRHSRSQSPISSQSLSTPQSHVHVDHHLDGNVIHSHPHDDGRHQSQSYKDRARHARGSSLRIDLHKSELAEVPKSSALLGHNDQCGSAPSPLTPNYRFGNDEHFATHHPDHHMPNLHDHSHVHGHSHEGHSHNMRGVFLHVMAVSTNLKFFCML